MKTDQEFWDAAILAAVSNMAGRRDYGHDFPEILVNDAERIADALTERRRLRQNNGQPFAAVEERASEMLT